MPARSNAQGLLGVALCVLLASCGTSSDDQAVAPSTPGGEFQADNSEKDLRPGRTPEPVRPLPSEVARDLVVEAIITLSMSPDVSLPLAQGVQAPVRVDIDLSGDVSSPDRYLRISGVLDGDPSQHLGCLYVELKDKLTSGRAGWLEVAVADPSADEKTARYPASPFQVKTRDWQTLPAANSPLTLATFAAAGTKAFDGALCLRLHGQLALAEARNEQVAIRYFVAEVETAGESLSEPGLGSLLLACGSAPAVLAAGQSTLLQWTGSLPMEDLEFQLRTDQASAIQDLGTWKATGDKQIKYTAPSQVLAERRIYVTAASRSHEILPAFCEVKLIPDDMVGIPDDGETRGLVGNVFELDSATTALPDFAQLTPLATLVVANFDVPVRHFEQGFPGVPDLIEWFGIEFTGRIWIPQAGTHRFRLTADDGARFYIDTYLTVDNDGVHPVLDQVGEVVLTQGWHDVTVAYFQGPRFEIALQLEWMPPDARHFIIIPSDAFHRPAEP